MLAYRVEMSRAGSVLIPVLDPTTHLPTDTLGRPMAQPSNPIYDFIYPAFAGDPVVQPYPLNLVVGSLIMPQDAGGGQFLYQFWYPLREDFWAPFELEPGTAIAWLPTNGRFLARDNPAPTPLRVTFDSYWRDNYPILKRGESLTYAGGEYGQENPLAQGLPGTVGWASAQVIFDSRTPNMLFTNLTGLTNCSARVIRPLDRYEVSYARASLPEDLTPASSEGVMAVRERYYFKALSGSLQKRLYYDSLREKLVFRGRLNDLEGDAPNVTAQPNGLYALEANVLSPDDFAAATGLSGAIALHIVQIGDERFRRAIQVVEAQNVFDEKINLQHTADFGGNTADAYYQ